MISPQEVAGSGARPHRSLEGRRGIGPHLGAVTQGVHIPRASAPNFRMLKGWGAEIEPIGWNGTTPGQSFRFVGTGLSARRKAVVDGVDGTGHRPRVV